MPAGKASEEVKTRNLVRFKRTHIEAEIGHTNSYFYKQTPEGELRYWKRTGRVTLSSGKYK